MNILRAALSVVGSAPPDRARLIDANTKKATRVEAVKHAREKLESQQTVVDEADQLARVAAAAQSKAREFRTEWARGGCKWSDTRELQALEAKALEASAAAEHATTNADVVRKMLPGSASALQSAEFDVRGADDEITAAISLIVVAEAAELCASYEQAAKVYLELRAQVLGVRWAITPPWRLANLNTMSPTIEAQELIDATLRRAEIKTFEAERESADARDYLNGTDFEARWRESLQASWRARAAALLRDPNAK
jgi:hypothetical protein